MTADRWFILDVWRIGNVGDKRDSLHRLSRNGGVETMAMPQRDNLFFSFA